MQGITSQIKQFEAKVTHNLFKGGVLPLVRCSLWVITGGLALDARKWYVLTPTVFAGHALVMGLQLGPEQPEQIGQRILRGEIIGPHWSARKGLGNAAGWMLVSALFLKGVYAQTRTWKAPVMLVMFAAGFDAIILDGHASTTLFSGRPKEAYKIIKHKLYRNNQ